MQCQFAQELFSDHIADALDRAQKVSLDNHLAACADCREQVAGLRSVWTALEALPVVEPPKFFHENIMDRIAMEGAKEQEAKQAVKAGGFEWRSLFGRRSLALGVAALVLLLGGVEAAQTQRGSLGPVEMVAQALSHLFAKPAPTAPLTLKTTKMMWSAGENGGTLTLTLRAAPLADGGKNTLRFTVNQAGNAAPLLADGVVTSDSDATAHISLPAPPAPDSLSITTTDRETSRTSAPQTLALPAP